jgi:hypothetical protein
MLSSSPSIKRMLSPSKSMLPLASIGRTLVSTVIVCASIQSSAVGARPTRACPEGARPTRARPTSRSTSNKSREDKGQGARVVKRHSRLDAGMETVSVQQAVHCCTVPYRSASVVHLAPAVTFVLYVYRWPRRTDFSQLPSAMISTVHDYHPLGSPSMYRLLYLTTYFLYDVLAYMY